MLTSGAVAKGISMGSRAINSSLGIIHESIKHTPDLYTYNKERVTKKTLKKTLDSYVANYVAEKIGENLFG